MRCELREVLVMGGTSDARVADTGCGERRANNLYPWRRQPEKRWLATH